MAERIPLRLIEAFKPLSDRELEAIRAGAVGLRRLRLARFGKDDELYQEALTLNVGLVAAQLLMERKTNGD